MPQDFTICGETLRILGHYQEELEVKETNKEEQSAEKVARCVPPYGTQQ